jgi:polar amino acid transport system substrate-binding protein
VKRSIPFALAFVAAAALVAGASTAQEKTIRLGTEGAYAPFNYTDQSGQPKGFEIDLGNALCERMKVKCVWVTQDWDGIIPALNAKKFDAIMASMSITPERRKSVDFSERYYQTPSRLVAKKGSGLTTDDPSTLKGKTVGVQRGTTHARYLETKLKDQVKINFYDTQENANLDLKDGRVDAVLADSAVQYEWLKQPENKDFDFAGKPLVDPEIFGDGVGIAFRKGDDALRTAFNKAIDEVTEDGTFQKINERYFPFSIR